MPSKKIMIVEDEMMIAADIEESLQGIGHRVVAIASSGSEALAKAQQLQPDLILMDIMLKGQMDGVAVAEAIHGELGCPIIFLTAYADNKTIQRVKKTEPFGYILKPFREKELHAMVDIALYKHEIEKQMRQQQQLLTQTLQHTAEGLITINLQSQVCFMNPAAARLTGYELNSAIGRQVTDVLNLGLDSPDAAAFYPPFVKNSQILIEFASKTHIEITPILNESQQTTGAVIHIYPQASTIVPTLTSALIPVCASCKKIRGEDGHRYQFESYLSKHYGLRFSHGICPDCSVQLYPDYFKPAGSV